MKKQIVLVLAFVASLAVACDDNDPRPVNSNGGTPVPSTETAIRSFYPKSGAPGTTVAIFGDNFGPTSSHNYVTFDYFEAEITHVGYGVITVRVPEGLPNRTYMINVNVQGSLATASDPFTVTDSKY